MMKKKIGCNRRKVNEIIKVKGFVRKDKIFTETEFSITKEKF